ncbi:MAG: dTDP-4-amino-4,6-dideoxygalactose transaminase [Vicingaceae bacterium]
MNKIPFNIPFLTGEESLYLADCINHNQFSGSGKYHTLLQNEFKTKYSFNHTFLTSSCTAAIELIALSIDLNPNDEIIFSSYTFPSTPTPFLQKGCKIVFADCHSNIPCLTLESIKACITKKTKAVMLTHYGGMALDLDEIVAICKAHHILLIEDAAQCIDAYYKGKPLGTFGDFGVFSFHQTKNIQCGEGGLLVVNNEHFIDNIIQTYENGTNRNAFLNNEVNYYEWVRLGLSFYMNEISAAFLYPQVKVIKSVTKKRKELWNTFHHSLKENKAIELPKISLIDPDFNAHVFYIICKDEAHRIAIKQQLTLNKIAAHNHFFPLHLSKFGKKLCNYSLPNTEKFGNCLLRLPLYYDLKIDDVKEVCEILNSI